MTDTDAGADAPETAEADQQPGIRILAQFIRGVVKNEDLWARFGL
jgi:hypothetical protein